MKPKLLISLRLVRNVLIAVFSAAFILPFYISANLILSYLGDLDQKTDSIAELLSGTFLDSVFFKMAEIFFDLAIILLAATTMFWAFVLANKFWPIKGRSKDEPNNK